MVEACACPPHLPPQSSCANTLVKGRDIGRGRSLNHPSNPRGRPSALMSLNNALHFVTESFQHLQKIGPVACGINHSLSATLMTLVDVTTMMSLIRQKNLQPSAFTVTLLRVDITYNILHFGNALKVRGVF